MNKALVYGTILGALLVVSLTGNAVLYSENSRLKETVDKLQEHDRATGVAREFVLALMGKPGPEQEKNIRAISTRKAQNKIFEEDPHGEQGPAEGVEPSVTIMRTYWNRVNTDKINVIVRFRIDFSVGNGGTTGLYEMGVDVIREGDGWKVDDYDFEEMQGESDRPGGGDHE
ncbi:hypothetical protein [Staphylospora marina]|uniref:hypothetical protein n=1 Tax=Staphylospora marina TaxID=2490858 RepID=UPI000F5C1473|nr:hypothetical protein [Staphylospora marina]